MFIIDNNDASPDPQNDVNEEWSYGNLEISESPQQIGGGNSSLPNSKEMVSAGIDFEILNRENPRVYTRFHRAEYNFDIGISHNLNHLLPNLLVAANEINEAYQQMTRPILLNYTPNDFYSVYIIHTSLKHKPIFIETKTIAQFNKQDFLNKIHNVSQSNDQFLLNGELKLTVMVTKDVAGAGGQRKYKSAPRTLEKKRRDRRSLIIIKNNGIYLIINYYYKL